MPDGVAIDRSYFDATRDRANRRATPRSTIKKRGSSPITKGIRSFTTTPQVFASIEHGASLSGRAARAGQLFHRAHCAERKSPRRFAAGLRPACPTPRCSRPTSFGIAAACFGCSTPALEPLSWAAPFSASSSARSSSRRRCIRARRTISRSLQPFAPSARRACTSSRSFSARRCISAVIGFSIAAAIDLALVKMTADAALPIVMTPGADRSACSCSPSRCAPSRPFRRSGS